MKTALITAATALTLLAQEIPMSHAESNPAEVRYKTQRIEGIDIFYREAGDPSKPAVVLLHGRLSLMS